MKMKTIVGLYDDLNTANQVVQALVNYGINRDEISLIAGDRKGSYASNDNHAGQRDSWDKTQTRDAGSAAAGGAVTGAVVGGMGGALLSLSALAIPGIGPVVAAGPLVAGLVGAGAGAAVGGLVGALTEAGVPEQEAGYYVEGVHRGGTLISVQVDDAETDQVVDIMNRYNPIDVKERAATWRSEARPDYGDSVSSTATGRMDQESDRFATQTMTEQAATSNYDRNYDRTTADLNTFQTEQTVGNGPSYDASAFRNHFQTNYANRGRTYEQYEPAYRYGYTLANDTRYRGRDWNAIEADARREWNQNHKDSAWEDFKEAVRYSWERAKEAVTS